MLGFMIMTKGKMDRSEWRIIVRDDQGRLWESAFGGMMPTQAEVEEMWREDRTFFTEIEQPTLKGE